jgi:hypothetical protein
MQDEFWTVDRLFCGTFVEETWRPRYISSSMPTLSVSGGN